MSVADELKKLAELRSQGVLTEAEFEQQKQMLLRGGPGQSATESLFGTPPLNWDKVPLSRRWWFQWLVTLVVTPFGLVLMAMVPAFRLRDRQVIPVGPTMKFVFGGIACALWGAAILATLPQPLPETLGAEQAVTEQTAEGEDALPSCENTELRNAAREAVEARRAAYGLPRDTYSHLFGQLTETDSADAALVRQRLWEAAGVPDGDIRTCAARNNGNEVLLTVVYLRDGAPTGGVLNFGIPEEVVDFWNQ
ncbi:MAG: SHOCT domain-containing protein [Hyphomonadaceae bacterium]